MKKNILFLLAFFIKIGFTFSQINANSLILTHKGTTAELNAITPQIGNIAYDTTEDRLVEYTSTGWKIMLIEENTAVGYFIITNSVSATTTTTMEQIVTGLPFEPSQITFSANPNVESFGLNDRDSETEAGNGTNTPRLQNTFGTMHGFARNDSGTTNQAVIYVGGSASSINSISRYSSDTECIGLRYSNNNGNNLGVISATITSFDTNGFTLDVTYTLGTTGNADRNNDIMDENVIVMYSVYR